MPGYFEALAQGAANVFGWPNILIPVGGTLLAMIVSFLPGIGSVSVMAVLLVLTLTWDPVSVLLLYGALVGGATFMGSVTAILFNIPGGAPNAAALLDGYPMARSGRPKTAIACAATASAVGSVFGVVILLGLLPVIRPLLLQFGPLERLLLGIWGLATIIAIPTKSVRKSAVMGVLGLLVAMIGIDPATADSRWTFGSLFLGQGLSVVVVLLGLFTLAEVISWTKPIHFEPAARSAQPRDSIREGVRAVFRHSGLTLRSSLIGTTVGIIPGVGGTVASFIAYSHAVQSARGDKSGFGHGDERGLVAPEAAVDAKDGGSLLPTVAFGLPGSEGGAILLTVLFIHGLVPGIPMLSDQLPLTVTLILALLLSNILTSLLGVAFTPALARLTDIRTDSIAVFAVVIGIVSVVLLRGQVEDLYVAIAFGAAGYVFKRYDWPRVPFIIAFLLGELIERNFVLSARLYEVGRLDVLQQPAAIAIAVLILVSVVWMRVRSVRSTRQRPLLGDLLISGGLLLLVAGMAAVAVLEGGYALMPSLVVLAALVLLAGTFTTQLLEYTRLDQGDAASPRRAGIPRDSRLPLAVLCLAIPSSVLMGYAPAVGLTTALWLWATGPRKAAAGTLAAAAGIAVGFGTHLLFADVFHLLLPPALLW